MGICETMNATSGELQKQLFDALNTRLVAGGDFVASDFEPGGRVGNLLEAAALVLDERGGDAVIEDLLTHIKDGRGDWVDDAEAGASMLKKEKMSLQRSRLRRYVKEVLKPVGPVS